MNYNDIYRAYMEIYSNKNYITQPYLIPEKIGSDLRTINSTSNVKYFSQPNFANRIVVFYHVKGTVSSGTIRMEMSPVESPTNWSTMSIDKAFTSVNSNSCFMVNNVVGPFHYVRARVIVALSSTCTVDVYIQAAR